MKEPKRVQKALTSLETIVDYLEYYMGDTRQFRDLVKDEITNIQELMKELSVDQKVQNARLAKKLKAIWERDHERE